MEGKAFLAIADSASEFSSRVKEFRKKNSLVANMKEVVKKISGSAKKSLEEFQDMTAGRE